MEPTADKKKSKMNMCTNRRLDIELQTDEHLREQICQSNLHYYRYREQLFHRKLERLRKDVEKIEPYPVETVEKKTATSKEGRFMKPNGSTRIQNHYRLMNFSSQTEKRLLTHAPFVQRPNQDLSDSLPNVNRRRVSATQTQLPRIYSCRSAIKPQFFLPLDDGIEKDHRPYFDGQIFDEHRKQRRQDERKGFLLKEFDELKHTIDDPNATLSVLAALSRALLFFDSSTE